MPMVLKMVDFVRRLPRLEVRLEARERLGEGRGMRAETRSGSAT